MKVNETENGVQLTYPNGWTASLAWKRPNHYAGEGTVEVAVLTNDSVVPGVLYNPDGWVPLMEVPIFLEEVERLGPVPSDPRIAAQLVKRAIANFHRRADEHDLEDA